MGRGAALLEHREECTGRWRVSAQLDVISCSRCGAEYPWSDERRFAVTFENIMGIKLCELACDGRKILRAERGMPGPDGGA
jgi:hypothetical protein